MIQNVKKRILSGNIDSDPDIILYVISYADGSVATCGEGNNRFWKEVQEWVSQGNTIVDED